MTRRYDSFAVRVRLAIALLGTLLLSVAATCARPDGTVNASSNQPSQNWTVELSSEGGIAGRGVGGVAVTPSTIDARDLSRSCKAPLTATEGAQLLKAVNDANPQGWKKLYADPAAPNGHPDQILYRLTYRAEPDGLEYTTSWHGEDLKWMPEPLAALYRRLQSLRSRALKSC